ncbi:MAG: hypothetical protein V4671_07900 [Armatimonadota bacterium]
MKTVKASLPLIGLLLVVVAASAAYASTYRNIYGYIYGPGTSSVGVSDILIHDTTDNTYTHADDIYWSTLSASGLRWYKNGLRADHAYTVTIYPYNGAINAKSTSFYLPSAYSNDQRVADFRF